MLRKSVICLSTVPLRVLKALALCSSCLYNCLSEETIVLPSLSEQCRNSNLGHIGDILRYGRSNGKGEEQAKLVTGDCSHTCGIPTLPRYAYI